MMVVSILNTEVFLVFARIVHATPGVSVSRSIIKGTITAADLIGPLEGSSLFNFLRIVAARKEEIHTNTQRKSRWVNRSALFRYLFLFVILSTFPIVGGFPCNVGFRRLLIVLLQETLQSGKIIGVDKIHFCLQQLMPDRFPL